VSGELLLGVDIGTYSAKGVLCAPDGEVLTEATIEHGLCHDQGGWSMTPMPSGGASSCS
jgi:xylulokinase